MRGHLKIFVLLPAIAIFGLTIWGSADEPAGGVDIEGVALMPDGETPWTNAWVYLHKITEEDEPEQLYLPLDSHGDTDTTRTDKQGEFAFQHVTSGDYWLQVWDSKSAMRNARISVEEGKVPTELIVIMSPVDLEGTVLDYEGGPPLSDAFVSFTREAGRLGRDLPHTRTDANGRFTFRGLEEGEYRVQAGSEKKKIVVRTDAPLGPVVLLEKPFTISGIVLRPDGEPASGVSVTGASRTTTTDPDGRFAIPRVRRGVYWVTAEGKDGECRRVKIPAERSSDSTLRLTRTTIEGEVLRADKETPFTDVVIWVNQKQETPYRSDLFHCEVRTDAHGRFRIPGCDDGEYVLTAKTGDRPVVTKEVSVPPERTTHVTIVEPDGIMAGTVVTPEGEAVVGASITAYRRDVGEGMHGTTTDSVGKFRLDHLSPGKYVLLVTHGNRQRRYTADVTAGKTSPPVRLVWFMPVVTVHFESPDGVPIGNARSTQSLITASGSGGSGWGDDPRLFTPGRAADAPLTRKLLLRDAPPIRYLFLFPGIGYALVRFDSLDHLTTEKEMHVRLQKGATIFGVIREQGTLTPVGGIPVIPYTRHRVDVPLPRDLWEVFLFTRHNVIIKGYPITAITSDDDGTYCLRNLPPGDYELCIGYEFGVGTRSFRLKERHSIHVQGEGVIENLDFVVPRASQAYAIHGRVLRQDGNTPLAGEEVILTLLHAERGEHMPWPCKGAAVPRTVTTDDEGRFRLYPVEPEEYWIKAWTADGPESDRMTVLVTSNSVMDVEFQLR